MNEWQLEIVRNYSWYIDDISNGVLYCLLCH